MSDFRTRYFEWLTDPDSSRARAAFAGLQPRIKDRVWRGFGQYIHKLVVYVRAHKLRGQVLKKRSGLLFDSFGAQLDFAGLGANFLETGYGAMWEHTGHKEIVPITGCQCSICRRSSEKWLHFKTERGWVRTQKVAAQLPRPHLAPSIEENKPLWEKLVLDPVVATLASAFKGEEGRA